MDKISSPAIPTERLESRKWPEPFAGNKAWRNAIKASRSLTLPAGIVVIHPGNPCQNFFVIENGTIRASQRASDGRTITLARARAGEICIFTLQALMENRDYDVELVSEVETHVLAVPQHEFYRCMSESEPFRRFVVMLLARQLCDITQLVQQVAFHGLDMRLASLLGQLFRQRNVTKVQITHLELANELGSSREVISRLLKEFEKKGCLRLGRGSIELVSHYELAQLTRPIIKVTQDQHGIIRNAPITPEPVDRRNNPRNSHPVWDATVSCTPSIHNRTGRRPSA